jgi:hypothetical protein
MARSALERDSTLLTASLEVSIATTLERSAAWARRARRMVAKKRESGCDAVPRMQCTVTASVRRSRAPSSSSNSARVGSSAAGCGEKHSRVLRATPSSEA